MKILVADDEKNIRDSLKILLKQDGFEVECAENGLSAKRFLEDHDYDAAVIDLKMPGMTGLELLDWLQVNNFTIPVIMISAFGQVEDAVHALKMGAHDYIVKPFDPEILLQKLDTLRDLISVSKHIRNEKLALGEEYFQGNSPAMSRLQIRILRIAATDATVMITGESGVGKEVTARALHRASHKEDRPFVAVNIGAVPENLLESELFGHEKGSFTGADRRKSGLFEKAENGTLFLDEIGEMPLQLQVKMLRVLQDKVFKRLGGLEDIPIKARIVAATNRKLEEMVKKSLFREDLYYRLNVARLEIPPLRERIDDLPQLCGFLLKKLNKRMNMNIQSFSKTAWEALKSYDYPGNIRELENILERAMIFADDIELTEEDLELKFSAQAEVHQAKQIGRTLKDLERETILAALQRWEWNRSRAAKELGISRRTIISKIKEFELIEE